MHDFVVKSELVKTTKSVYFIGNYRNVGIDETAIETDVDPKTVRIIFIILEVGVISFKIWTIIVAMNARKEIKDDQKKNSPEPMVLSAQDLTEGQQIGNKVIIEVWLIKYIIAKKYACVFTYYFSYTQSSLCSFTVERSYPVFIWCIGQSDANWNMFFEQIIFSHFKEEGT